MQEMKITEKEYEELVKVLRTKPFTIRTLRESREEEEGERKKEEGYMTESDEGVDQLDESDNEPVPPPSKTSTIATTPNSTLPARPKRTGRMLRRAAENPYPVVWFARRASLAMHGVPHPQASSLASGLSAKPGDLGQNERMLGELAAIQSMLSNIVTRIDAISASPVHGQAQKVTGGSENETPVELGERNIPGTPPNTPLCRVDVTVSPTPDPKIDVIQEPGAPLVGVTQGRSRLENDSGLAQVVSDCESLIGTGIIAGWGEQQVVRIAEEGP